MKNDRSSEMDFMKKWTRVCCDGAMFNVYLPVVFKNTEARDLKAVETRYCLYEFFQGILWLISETLILRAAGGENKRYLAHARSTGDSLPSADH